VVYVCERRSNVNVLMVTVTDLRSLYVMCILSDQYTDEVKVKPAASSCSVTLGE
jgi:hypothetical protein